MPTVYVSNSATNGYASGSDSNSYAQAQSKSTPFLTIDKALRASTNGDTIHVNNGTYVENTSAAGYLAVNNGAYTLQPETALGVTIQATSVGAARVMHVAQAGQGLVVQNIVFDGQGNQTQCITMDGSNQLSALTFTGCSFINWTTYGVRWADCANGVMSGCSVTGTPTVTNSYGIYINPLNATRALTDAVTITGCTVTLTTARAETAGINFSSPQTAPGGSVTLTNNTVSITSTVSTNALQPIQISNGGPTVSITGNTCTCTLNSPSASNNATGIFLSFGSSATAISPAVTIANNILTAAKGSSTGAAGHGISVGPDADTQPAGAYTYTGVKIYGNVVNGNNHGILVNWIVGALVWGNTVSNVVLGLVDKLSTSCLWTGNVVSKLDGTNAALRSKGSTAAVFANNLVLLDNTCNTSFFILCNQDATGPVGSTGCLFANNLLYATAQVTNAVSVDTLSSATFAHNNYFSTVSFGAAAFIYQSSTYTTFAAWQAAQETTATNVDPTFASYAGGDYRVPATNVTLYRTGAFVNRAGPEFRGRPFAYTPTIGAYEVSGGDTAAARVTRT